MNCTLCLGPCKAAAPHRVGHIRQALSHGCDGPITPFVLICRAMDLAKLEGVEEGRGGRLSKAPDDFSNALYEELAARGWIVDSEDAIEETDS